MAHLKELLQTTVRRMMARSVDQHEVFAMFNMVCTGTPEAFGSRRFAADGLPTSCKPSSATERAILEIQRWMFILCMQEWITSIDKRGLNQTPLNGYALVLNNLRTCLSNWQQISKDALMQLVNSSGGVSRVLDATLASYQSEAKAQLSKLAGAEKHRQRIPAPSAQQTYVSGKLPPANFLRMWEGNIVRALLWRAWGEALANPQFGLAVGLIRLIHELVVQQGQCYIRIDAMTKIYLQRDDLRILDEHYYGVYRKLLPRF